MSVSHKLFYIPLEEGQSQNVVSPIKENSAASVRGLKMARFTQEVQGINALNACLYRPSWECCFFHTLSLLAMSLTLFSKLIVLLQND